MVNLVSDFIILNMVIIVSRFQKNITNFWRDLNFIDIDMSRFEAVHYVLKYKNLFEYGWIFLARQ